MLHTGQRTHFRHLALTKYIYFRRKRLSRSNTTSALSFRTDWHELKHPTVAQRRWGRPTLSASGRKGNIGNTSDNGHRAVRESCLLPQTFVKQTKSIRQYLRVSKYERHRSSCCKAHSAVHVEQVEAPISCWLEIFSFEHRSAAQHTRSLQDASRTSFPARCRQPCQFVGCRRRTRPNQTERHTLLFQFAADSRGRQSGFPAAGSLELVGHLSICVSRKAFLQQWKNLPSLVHGAVAHWSERSLATRRCTLF